MTEVKANKKSSGTPYAFAIAFILVSSWQAGIFNDYIPPEYKNWKRQTQNVMDDVTFMSEYGKIVSNLENTAFIRETRAGEETLLIKSDYVYRSAEEAELVKLQHVAMFAHKQGQYGVKNPISLTSKTEGVVYLDNAVVEEHEGKYRVVLTLKYKFATV